MTAEQRTELEAALLDVDRGNYNVKHMVELIRRVLVIIIKNQLKGN